MGCAAVSTRACRRRPAPSSRTLPPLPFVHFSTSALSIADLFAQVIVCGDKPKQQLQRSVPKNLVLTFKEIGRQIPTFEDACEIADMIETSKVEYDKVKIVYNKWISALSYEADIMEVATANALKNARARPFRFFRFFASDALVAAKFLAYEVEDEDLIKDLTSFALANAVFNALAEGHATEQSARRNGPFFRFFLLFFDSDVIFE